MHTGKIIRLLRGAKGWSQKDLSDRVNVARTYLAQVESGKRTPGLVLLRDAARELDVPVALLLVDDSGPDRHVNEELRKLLTHVLEARRQIAQQAG